VSVRSQQLDRFLAWLATRQHGVVTRQQLLSQGFSRRQIERKVASGALIPVHPGIYLVGHRAVSPLAYEAAAILACQPDALLSHSTAGRLSRLPVPDGGPIHVTVVGRGGRRSLRGVRVQRITDIAASERRFHEGLPLTAPGLTLLDLAGSLPQPEFLEALNEARALQSVSDAELRRVLQRHPKRKGARVLRFTLETERGPRITRSVAERQALEAMTAHGIVPDASDHPIGPYRVDFWFERERVAVEVDGYRYHSTPKRFVDDRRRAAYLAGRGVLTFPMTWQDTVAPANAMAALRQTLASRR
jgi:Transcriptional regulator, AbiEi antitoxin/Protein of unknown function (DUF559)